MEKGEGDGEGDGESCGLLRRYCTVLYIHVKYVLYSRYI